MTFLSLECRRLAGDHKTMRQGDNESGKGRWSLTFFPRVKESKTNGHKFKVRGERVKRDQRNIFFALSMLGIENKFPEEAVEVATIYNVSNTLR